LPVEKQKEASEAHENISAIGDNFASSNNLLGNYESDINEKLARVSENSYKNEKSVEKKIIRTPNGSNLALKEKRAAQTL